MKETFYDEKYQSLTFGRYGKTVVNTGPTLNLIDLIQFYDLSNAMFYGVDPTHYE